MHTSLTNSVPVDALQGFHQVFVQFVRRYPRLVKQVRCQHLDEPLGLGRDELAPSDDDPVATRGEVLAHRDCAQAITFLQADAGDDGNPKSLFHVFLDHRPAPGLQGDLVGDVVLLEHGFDDAPGTQITGRQDQVVLRDFFQ